MALFELGRTVATPAALKFCEQHSVNLADLLGRHVSADWGDLTKDDVKANEDAIAFGARVFSSYKVGDDKVWVITEADRSSTCVLLPSDY
jgi:hypothetical protein